MKNSKTCPKCGGREIYSNTGITKSGQRALISVNGWKSMYVDVYLCISCGYLEEYIKREDLKNEKIATKLKKNWRKL